jgi:L-lactate dehydrogenase complex protein LldF
MSTTVPPVHIAVTGIEKVVEKISDIPPLLSILTRSATGQPITTYFNMISGARKPDEKDGPTEVHLVLLDNGRSRIYSDPELLETLRCIRCGACINHCPVYVRIGGHAYNTVYPGPIGTVLEPQKDGLDQHPDLPQASSLCGACGEVCPVKITLPNLINRLRFEGVKQNNKVVKGSGTSRKFSEAIIWKIWAWWYSGKIRYQFMTELIGLFGRLMPKTIGAWTSIRTAPEPKSTSLHQAVKSMELDDE